MFHLRNVKYKDILNISNLHISANKVTCIVGESGSGKTTLLKLLNNLISSDAGEITFKGNPIESLDPIILRREVVMLPQSPSIFNGSIRDNLLIGRRFSEKPDSSNEELKRTLEMVNLNKSLEDDAEKLSGGEKQRLALGRVILMEPEVFLLDEPSSSLDETTEQLIIEKLVAFTKSKNKALVMVTHSKKVAENFSDETVEILKGKVVEGKE